MLNSCPFCRSRAKIEKSSRVEYSEKGLLLKQSDRWRAICTGCDIATNWEKSRDIAVQKWNRREDETTRSDTDTADLEQG